MIKCSRPTTNNYFRVNLHLPSQQVQSTSQLKLMVVVIQSLFLNGLPPIAVTHIFSHSNQWKMQSLVKKFSIWTGQKVLEKPTLNLCFFKTFSPVSNTLLKLSQSTVWVKDLLHPNTLSPSNKCDVSNVTRNNVSQCGVTCSQVQYLYSYENFQFIIAAILYKLHFTANSCKINQNYKICFCLF